MSKAREANDFNKHKLEHIKKGRKQKAEANKICNRKIKRNVRFAKRDTIE